MEEKKLNQVERVLRHLKEHNGITSWEAIKEYGCTRLSGKIYLLRKRGYLITNEDVYARNRYDEPVHFVRYHLVPKPAEVKEPWWKRVRFFM